MNIKQSYRNLCRKSGGLRPHQNGSCKDNGVKSVVLYINTPKKQIAKIVQTSSGNDLVVITDKSIQRKPKFKCFYVQL